MGVKSELTAKQERFCQEYVVDSNATQAAIRVGFSKKTANVQAARLLTNVNIRNRIKELQQELQMKTSVTAERVINELAKIAFADARSFFDSNGNLIPIEQLDEGAAGALSSFEVSIEKSAIEEETFEQSSTKKIRLWDKVKALESLGKHLGIFEEHNKQKANAPVALNIVPYSPDGVVKPLASSENEISDERDSRYTG
jgi:phage terminase small subunit